LTHGIADRDAPLGAMQVVLILKDIIGE